MTDKWPSYNKTLIMKNVRSQQYQLISTTFLMKLKNYILISFYL